LLVALLRPDTAFADLQFASRGLSIGSKQVVLTASDTEADDLGANMTGQSASSPFIDPAA